jgi:hypothetical protein
MGGGIAFKGGPLDSRQNKKLVGTSQHGRKRSLMIVFEEK